MSDQDKFLSTIKYKIMQTSDGIIEYINWRIIANTIQNSQN